MNKKNKEKQKKIVKSNIISDMMLIFDEDYPFLELAPEFYGFEEDNHGTRPSCVDGVFHNLNEYLSVLTYRNDFILETQNLNAKEERLLNKNKELLTYNIQKSLKHLNAFYDSFNKLQDILTFLWHKFDIIQENENEKE